MAPFFLEVETFIVSKSLGSSLFFTTIDQADEEGGVGGGGRNFLISSRNKTSESSELEVYLQAEPKFFGISMV
jgi:hypothetical protein